MTAFVSFDCMIFTSECLVYIHIRTWKNASFLATPMQPTANKAFALHFKKFVCWRHSSDRPSVCQNRKSECSEEQRARSKGFIVGFSGDYILAYDDAAGHRLIRELKTILKKLHERRIWSRINFLANDLKMCRIILAYKQLSSLSLSFIPVVGPRG